MFKSRVPLVLFVLCTLSATSAFAQSSRRPPVYHDVKALGVGRTAFFPYPQRPVGDPRRLEPLSDAASLARMGATRGMENDIRRVLALGGVRDAQQVAADVVRVMRGGFSTTRKAESCDTAFPSEGELVECGFPVGGTLPWMAYRPDGRTPGVVRNFRWAGDAPFEAFVFRAYSRGRSYTILVPKPCGNLSITESRAELRVTKVAAQERFAAGSQVAYTITVRNAAPGGSLAATNVRLTDTLPTAGGLAWNAASGSGDACTLSGANLNCTFGTLAPSDFRTVTVVSTTSTPYDACRTQQNTARATADNAPAAEGSATSTCVPPVLVVNKGPKNGTFQIAAPATFTITVRNDAAAGGSAATHVVLTDTLPTNGGLEWESATPAGCRVTGNSLRCELGTLAAQQAVNVTVTSKPAPFAACVSQPNTARVVADGGLAKEDNATLSCTPPQLAVEKTPDDGSFKPGGQATFTIAIRNTAPAGASPATSVKLTDTLPTRGGLTWENATASAGTCQLSGAQKGSLACDLGSIPAGQAVAVTVTSTLKTPRAACQTQTNLAATATADGGLTAQDAGSITCDPSVSFFADGFFGKDRRVRPIDGRQTLAGAAVRSNVGPVGGVDFAQCSPMFGFDLGMAKALKHNWEVAAKAGLGLSAVRKDSKVREHEVLVDVEANKYLRQRGGAFVGGGLSMWDVFHSDTVTPAALVHVGLPLGSHPSHPTHFVGEGRWLLREAGDLANNYQFWGGVRVKF
ncbi:MAG: DUF11 domain-containing protein [Vicinamibacterales bacterium]